MKLFRQNRTLPSTFDECSTIVETVKRLASCSKGHPPTECCSFCPVQWTEVDSGSPNGVHYYVVDGSGTSPTEESKKWALQKIVVKVSKPVDAVMGSLIAESTARLSTQPRGPSFIDGEVLSIVEPFGQYEHPDLPLVTTKKMRYSFGAKKVKREFFLLEKCEKFQKTSSSPEMAVRAFVSLDAPDEVLPKDYKRAFAFPGSGFVVQADPQDGGSSSYVSLIIDVDLQFTMLQRQQKSKALRDMLDVVSSTADQFAFLAQHEKASAVTFVPKGIGQTRVSISSGQNTDKVKRLMGTQLSVRQIEGVKEKGAALDILPCDDSPLNREDSDAIESEVVVEVSSDTREKDDTLDQGNRASEVHVPTTTSTNDEELVSKPAKNGHDEERSEGDLTNAAHAETSGAETKCEVVQAATPVPGGISKPNVDESEELKLDSSTVELHVTSQKSKTCMSSENGQQKGFDEVLIGNGPTESLKDNVVIAEGIQVAGLKNKNDNETLHGECDVALGDGHVLLEEINNESSNTQGTQVAATKIGELSGTDAEPTILIKKVDDEPSATDSEKNEVIGGDPKITNGEDETATKQESKDELVEEIVEPEVNLIKSDESSVALEAGDIGKEVAEAKRKEENEILRRQEAMGEKNRNKLLEIQGLINQEGDSIDTAGPAPEGEACEEADGGNESDDDDGLLDLYDKITPVEEEMLKTVNMTVQQYQWLKLTQKENTNSFLLAEQWYEKSEDNYLVALWKQSRAEALRKKSKRIIDDVLYPPRARGFRNSAARKPFPLGSPGDARGGLLAAIQARGSAKGGDESRSNKEAPAGPRPAPNFLAELKMKAKGGSSEEGGLKAKATSSEGEEAPSKAGAGPPRGPPMGMFAELQARARAREASVESQPKGENSEEAKPSRPAGMFAELQAKAKARQESADNQEPSAAKHSKINAPPLGMFAELQAKAKARQSASESSKKSDDDSDELETKRAPASMLEEIKLKSSSNQQAGEGETGKPKGPPMGMFAELQAKAKARNGGAEVESGATKPVGFLAELKAKSMNSATTAGAAKQGMSTKKDDKSVTKYTKLWFKLIQAKLDHKVKKLSVVVEKCLNDKEMWEERMENAPEREKVLNDREVEWFNKERKANNEALTTMRKLIPVEIRELSVKQLRERYKQNKGVCPMRLATELYRNKLLHWIVTPTIEISKSSFLRDSNAMFFRSFTDLDIVELRALACKLEGVVFALDKEGTKKQWRSDFLKHVRNLVAREKGELVKGGVDPTSKKRTMVPLPALTAREKRREIYYFESSEYIKRQEEKLQRLEQLRKEREARLKQIVEVELKEAKAEYNNAVTDSRNPEFIAYFGREKLRVIRDQARESKNKLESEQKTLESKLKLSVKSAETLSLAEYQEEIMETNAHLSRVYGAKLVDMEKDKLIRQKAIMREVLTGALRRMKSRQLFDAFHLWTRFTAPKPFIKASRDKKYKNSTSSSGDVNEFGILVDGVFDPNAKLPEQVKMESYNPNKSAEARQEEIKQLSDLSKNRASLFNKFQKMNRKDQTNAQKAKISQPTAQKPAVLPNTAAARSKGILALLAEAKSNLPADQQFEEEEVNSSPVDAADEKPLESSISNTDVSLERTEISRGSISLEKTQVSRSSTSLEKSPDKSSAPVLDLKRRLSVPLSKGSMSSEGLWRNHSFTAASPTTESAPVHSRTSPPSTDNTTSAVRQLLPTGKPPVSSTLQQAPSSGSQETSDIIAAIKSAKGQESKLWQKRTGAENPLGISVKSESGASASEFVQRHDSAVTSVSPLTSTTPTSDIAARLSALGLTGGAGRPSALHSLPLSAPNSRQPVRSTSPANATADIIGEIRKHSLTPPHRLGALNLPTSLPPKEAGGAVTQVTREGAAGGLTHRNFLASMAKTPGATSLPLASPSVGRSNAQQSTGTNNLTDEIQRLLKKSSAE